MAKPEEIQKLVDQVMAQTGWPQTGQPAASTFFSVPRDLKIIRVYGSVGYDKPDIKHKICLRHRFCRGEIRFDLDKQDPIMSEYVCTGMTPEGYDFCRNTWKLADVEAMSFQTVANEFYTELLEAAKDLGDWPMRLCEVQDRAIRYTAMRPVTKGELIRSRVHRLLDIRGSAS